jgi:hypothetical protein
MDVTKTEVIQIANVQMRKCLTLKLMHGSILTALQIASGIKMS